MKIKTSGPPLYGFLFTLILSIAIRIFIFNNYEVFVLGCDPDWYVKIAKSIFENGFQGYEAERTPGYPLFFYLLSYNYDYVWLAQSIFGVINVMILYICVFWRTQSVTWSCLAAFLLTFLCYPIFQEAVPLPESLVLSLLSFALISFELSTKTSSPKHEYLYLILASFFVGYAVMVRPDVVGVYIIFFIYLIFWQRGLQQKIKLYCYVLPTLMMILICGTVNYCTVGAFTMTSLLGMNFTTHSGGMMEKAPDEYGTIRDIYVKYRERHIQRTGSYLLTISDGAEAEMRQKLNLTPLELSRELTKVSFWLFQHYPMEYLNNVKKAWLAFWGSNQKVVDPPSLSNGLLRHWMLSKWPFYFLRLVYLGFGCVVILNLCLWIKLKNRTMVLLMGAIVFFEASFLALVTYGSGPRYASCYYIFVIYALILGLASLCHSLSKNKNTSHAQKFS